MDKNHSHLNRHRKSISKGPMHFYNEDIQQTKDKNALNLIKDKCEKPSDNTIINGEKSSFSL